MKNNRKVQHIEGSGNGFVHMLIQLYNRRCEEETVRPTPAHQDHIICSLL